ncbi:MAG: YdcF family protein [Candidatus Rokubacteria bacterium]|nr:YdcF family protein [Candidatus Rokubacteria bacterium]
MIRRARRALVGTLALAFVAVVLAGVLPVRSALFRLLLVAEPPRRADAIVVLGGGVDDGDTPGLSTASRLVHGLRLHHRGHAPLVILTGGNPVRPEIPESVVMQRVAREVGFPQAPLVLETVADRTVTQATAVAQLARARGIRTILLVTSPEHSWRAARVFRKTGLEVISTPVIGERLPGYGIVVHPLYVASRVAALLPCVYELGAIAVYWWRGWL